MNPWNKGLCNNALPGFNNNCFNWVEIFPSPASKPCMNNYFNLIHKIPEEEGFICSCKVRKT